MIIVGLKLETNDNLETIFLPIITSNSISNLDIVGVLDIYVCNLWKYLTQYVMNVKIHINTAHDGFWNECYMCDHKATSNGRLITHKQVVHGGIRFSLSMVSDMNTQTKIHLEIFLM